VDFDEARFFSAIERSGCRALLIGRRALVALGLPVITFDYDLWIHIDDQELLNRSLAALDLSPNLMPDAARARGRYVLENHERVDVLVAREVPTVDAVRVSFDALWSRRRSLEVAPGVSVAVPSLEDLILTKRFAARPKDLEDIRMLTALKGRIG
jgi:hypothetical protein